jgi:hypothetical protein
MHKRVGKLIGTLKAGTLVYDAPLAMQARGVMFIAAHPDEPVKLITPWGIVPLVFIPDGAPVVGSTVVGSHSISTGTVQ